MSRKLKLLILLLLVMRSKRRNLWVHPINEKRAEYGEFHQLIPDLKLDRERFFTYFRMYPEKFQILLDKIRNRITKSSTYFRNAICPEERLAVTLRYSYCLFANVCRSTILHRSKFI